MLSLHLGLETVRELPRASFFIIIICFQDCIRDQCTSELLLKEKAPLSAC